MPTLDEVLGKNGQKTPLASALAAGVQTISLDATIRFRRYLRLVLPADGYLFWVRADLLSDSAKHNAAWLNGVAMNQPEEVLALAPYSDLRGSLHYTTTANQGEAATSTVNRVVFTAIDAANDLNAIRPGELLIGEFQGLRFAFSERRSFYDQARLNHYVGDAVYPDMESQLIDDPSTFDASSVVVSNSLPIWLSMNDVAATAVLPFGNAIPLFPSYLVPDDVRPPFGAVHVVPDSTEAIGNAPLLGPTLSHAQLSKERVRVTLWGQRNYSALDFLDFVGQFSLAYDTIGLMNSPVPRDEKRTQSELSTIAMKKVIEFEVSYYQATARAIARQAIKSAIPTYVENPF